MLILITLNTEKYQQNVGQLPDCFLHACTVEVSGNHDSLTSRMKSDAIQGYWIKAGGTGGYKTEEKLKIDLFNFSII